MATYRKVARIEVTGNTLDDLLTALDEAKRKIQDEFIAGSDCNDTSDYEFTVTNELQESV